MVTETNIDVKYDVFKTLHIVEHNKSLDMMLRGGNTNLSYAMLRTMAKKNTLTPEISGTLKKIFERLILTTPSILEKYVAIGSENDKPKISKHYGKKRILADIAANQTKTELDRAMLALNDLRNIYSRLKSRGIKDKTQGTKKLTRDDCRAIIATVRIVENKLSHILKKK
jgi:hypothetical protein